MNYAVMYEYAVDKDSSQFKAPFNHIKNEARVYTYEDTAVVTPNSDTPYSVLWLDLRAEPIVLSVRAVEKSRYYSVQLCDGNTFNYGYIGRRATGPEPGDYMVVGPDWKGETPVGIKKVFRSSMIPVARSTPRLMQTIPASSITDGTSLRIAVPSRLPSTGTSEMNAVARVAPSATIARLNENSDTTPIKKP
jgi:hypothetical protein